MSGHCPGWPVKLTWSLMVQVLVSPGPRLEARVKNATVPPSPLIAGSVLTSLDCPPMPSTLTRAVVPVTRLRTKTSGHSPGYCVKSATPGSEQVFVSPEVRLEAIESKAINVPPALIAGPKSTPPRTAPTSGPALAPFACPPVGLTLTRWVTPVLRSEEHTSELQS